MAKGLHNLIKGKLLFDQNIWEEFLISWNSTISAMVEEKRFNA